MRKSLLRASLATVFAIVLGSSVTLAADNWLGTWKMNAAKSRFAPAPGPRSQTLKFEATAEGTRLTSETVDADGKEVQGGYVSRFDGKDVPWEGNPNADTASSQRINANAYVNTWKMGGKATITSKARVSRDGKTLTINQTGRNSKGETVHSTVVYDKQ